MNRFGPPNRRRKLWRIVLWPLFGVCTIVLVAWMFLPHLDGRRYVFVNEAASVGRLRTINWLQARYSEAHPNEGFACELSRLKSTEQVKDSDYDPDALLVSGTQSGYRFTLVNCRAAHTGPVAHYEVTAVPLEPGRSGIRAFCTDDSGLLWYDSNGSAEGCLALRHKIE